jgi:hypothetical protein
MRHGWTHASTVLAAGALPSKRLYGRKNWSEMVEAGAVSMSPELPLLSSTGKPSRRCEMRCAAAYNDLLNVMYASIRTMYGLLASFACVRIDAL